MLPAHRSVALLFSAATVAILAGRSGSVWAAAKELKIPPPETVTLETKDGVILQCAYYPGGFMQKSAKEIVRVPGKEVVPIIMLHGWGQQRREFSSTATMLQKQGHAVVVPDLRGHGESTKMKFGGSEVSISQGQMRPADMNTVLFDVEAVRKFLLEKNNREELNISMLCVVGAEWGAVIAVNWVALDWNRPQLPAFKQGRDAKAIVLLSPPLQFKGVSSKTALKYPIFRSGLSIMLVAGKGDAKGNADAKAIYNQLERSHEIPSGTPEEKSKRRTLFLIEPETSLGGTELLKAKGLTVNQELIRFVWFRLVSRKNDFAWSDHKSPLSPE